MRKRIHIIIGILAFLVYTISCTPKEQECYQPMNTTAKAAFMVREIRDSIIVTDTSTRDTTIYLRRDTGLIAPVFYSIDEIPALRIAGTRGANVMAFPLNPDKDSIKYLIKADSTLDIADTLTIYYSAILKFVSNDCGFTNYYNIVNYKCTNNIFDSVSLQTKEVTNLGSDRHLLLYIFNN